MVHDDGIGEVRGYARCAVEPAWDAAGPRGTVRVRQVEALDPVVYAALWGFLFGIDLTSSVAVAGRPVDDALPHLVADMRRCGIGLRGSLFVRPVEAGAATAARARPACGPRIRPNWRCPCGRWGRPCWAGSPSRHWRWRPGRGAAAGGAGGRVGAFGSDAAPWLPDGF